jgi:hypothetical protein
MIISRGTEWSAADAVDHNIVILHWIGGSYGHFIYRMLHAHLAGLPEIKDDFSFDRGSSHSIRKNFYISVISPKTIREDNIVLKFVKDVDARYVMILNHSTTSAPIMPFNIVKRAYLNIKVVLDDPSLYAWSIIQNIIKLDNPHDYYDSFLVDSILTQNIDPGKIQNLLEHCINSLQKYWYMPENKSNFQNVMISDVIDDHKMTEFMIKVADRLNVETVNMESFKDEMQKFRENQLHLDSLLRHLNRTWDNTNPFDCLLKGIYENTNRKRR